MRRRIPFGPLFAVVLAGLILGLLYHVATLPVIVPASSTGGVNVVLTMPPYPTALDQVAFLSRAEAAAISATEGKIKDALSAYTQTQTPVAATAQAYANERMHAIAHNEIANQVSPSRTPSDPLCGTAAPGQTCDTTNYHVSPTPTATNVSCDVVLQTPYSSYRIPGDRCTWDTPTPPGDTSGGLVT